MRWRKRGFAAPDTPDTGAVKPHLGSIRTRCDRYATASHRGLNVKNRLWIAAVSIAALGLSVWTISPHAEEPATQTIAPTRETVAPEIEWLRKQSMLHQAAEAAKEVSGRGVQWRHPFGEPRPRDAVKKA